MEVSWAKFPDGFPNLFVEGAEEIRGKHVAFLASFNNPDTIFEQILSVIYSLPKMFYPRRSRSSPLLPHGHRRARRARGRGATAVTLARMLSHIPMSRGGPTQHHHLRHPRFRSDSTSATTSRRA